jgi:signal transduction histidine kinase
MFTATDGPCIQGFGIPADHHIETHGGEIWAERTGENKGAVFTFMLPLAK